MNSAFITSNQPYDSIFEPPKPYKSTSFIGPPPGFEEDFNDPFGLDDDNHPIIHPSLFKPLEEDD